MADESGFVILSPESFIREKIKLIIRTDRRNLLKPIFQA